MRVLFVGGKDLVGTYSAARLYKEGNTVCWLTALEEGELWDSGVKGNIYRTSLKSSQCKSIFKANGFDVVIFMTSDHRDNIDSGLSKEYDSILPELMNILKLSYHYKVKQFVFLSSTELYKEEGITPILADLMAGEMLCNTWYERYSMPILTLRISSVYGAASYENMGYVGYIARNMLGNNDIYTTYSKEGSIDLLYAEDAADAIYRAIEYKKTGSYNLCSGHAIAVTEYFRLLSEYYHYSGKIRFSKDDKVKQLDLDTDTIKEELGWIAMHDFKDKLTQVLDQAKVLSDQEEKPTVKQKDSILYKCAVRIYPFLENILLFLISIFVLNFTKDYSDFRFVDVRLVYVVIISATYGLKQSILSIILACISYGYSVLNAGIDLTYLIYSVETWTPFIMYIITGASVAYCVDKKKDDIEAIKEEHTILENKYIFLKDVYRQMCDVKEQLQRQIVGSKDSFGRVYELTTQLDASKPEMIYFRAIGILEDIMDTRCAAIYTLNSNNLSYARLMANSKSLAGTLSSSLKLTDYPELKEALLAKSIFINKKLIHDYPSFAAPIVDGDDVIALVILYDVDFEKFTLYYQNLFKVIVGLIQNNLVRAYKYNRGVFVTPYIEGTAVYTPQEFAQQLKIIEEAKADIKLEYVVAQVEVQQQSNISAKEVYQKVEPLLRSTDFIGYDGTNYYVVLMQTGLKYIENISQRFSKAGLKLEWEA